MTGCRVVAVFLVLSLGNCVFAQSERKFDAAWIPQDAFFGAAAFPRDILGSTIVKSWSPAAGPLADPVIHSFDRQLGFRLDEIEKLQVVAIRTDDGPLGIPFDIGAVIQLSNPCEADGIILFKGLAVEASTHHGKPYYQLKNYPADIGYFMPDKQTIVIGGKRLLDALIASHESPNEGPVSNLISRHGENAAVVAFLFAEPIRGNLAKLASCIPQPEIRKALQLAEKIETIGIKVSGEEGLYVSALCIDESNAQEVKKTVERFIELGISWVASEKQRMLPILHKVPPSERLWYLAIDDAVRSAMEALKPELRGKRLVIQPDVEDLIAHINSVAASARAARAELVEYTHGHNFKMLMLALDCYCDANLGFPPAAICDANGKPLLSWRVAILPWLGKKEEELFKQFRQDEAWDSEHNKALLAEMPEVFRSPYSTADFSLTTYLMPVGPGSVGEAKDGVSRADFRDGLSRTAMCVEVDDDHAVPWTKPADWEFSTKEPLVGLGDAHPRGVFGVAMADGSVRFIRKDVDEKKWKAALTYAGGETEGLD
jgi:hypothetical protein